MVKSIPNGHMHSETFLFNYFLIIISCAASFYYFKQSAENRRKECHRFWLRLRHVVVLISNNRTSASKKINGMALIRTLTVSTTASEMTKRKFYGFRQTVKSDSKVSALNRKIDTVSRL